MAIPGDKSFEKGCSQLSKIQEKLKGIKEDLKFNWYLVESAEKAVRGTTPETFNASREMLNNMVISNLCFWSGIPISILGGLLLGGKTGTIIALILIPTFIGLGILFNKRSQIQYAHLNQEET